MAHSQPAAYPQRPVRVLVGLVPGGNPDVLARIVAAKLTESFGQQFIVENRPGMSSGIAADVVAKAPPDGHAIFIGDSGVVTTNPHLYKSLPYDPFRDLAPVTLAVVVPMWLVVHPSVPARSVKELVALARSHKEPLLYASSGNGSIHHITMEAFKAATRIDMTHVPYRGAGQSVPAMLAGEVMVAFLGYPAMSGAIKAGRLRVLAFSMPRRSTLTPEVPTIAETVAAGFDMAAPLGVFVAGGTRREIVLRLNQAVGSAIRSPDVAARMAAIGMEPAGLPPEAYEKNLREEHERLGSLIRRIGMRLD
ncbi:MAG: Bug family tripartite tricarboxylate transporter substrate binding protein [Burkholderiales bacterium]